MRIRKRLLSLSAATPPPSSDPHGGGGHHQLVQQQEVHPSGNLRVAHDDGDTHSLPSDPFRRPTQPASSDHAKQIGLPPPNWVSSGAGSEPKQPLVFTHKVLESERGRETSDDSYTGRKERVLGAEASNSAGSTSLPPPLTTSHLVSKGWLEGDSLIPIKKRRGSLGTRVNHGFEEEHEKTMPKTHSKSMLMKEIDTSNVKSNKKMKKKNGNVTMEGSRCSRVNGRGWQCCQTTLVGYSLCEHHLGKGRVRSLASVRGQAPKQQKDEKTADSHELQDYEVADLEDTKKMSKKKKKTLGMVKAKSLSSLMGQIGS